MQVECGRLYATTVSSCVIIVMSRATSNQRSSAVYQIYSTVYRRGGGGLTEQLIDKLNVAWAHDMPNVFDD